MPSERLSLEFGEFGGYDCMTGAWAIRRDGKTLVVVDQADFGQKRCDYDFRSEEARRVAEICFNALRADME